MSRLFNLSTALNMMGSACVGSCLCIYVCYVRAESAHEQRKNENIRP